MSYIFKETVLYVDNLAVRYGDTTIIKNVNMVEKNVVRNGIESTAQFIAVVGRSGRGKSTFLKALTGIVPCADGKILIKDFKNDDPNAAKDTKEGDIGFVDQKYTLFRHKTIYQTLLFALRKTTLTPAEKTTKIAEYLKVWGLEKFKDKYPNELSGGQKQRTAIIEQLFSSDRFIVMDEPFSGLDVGNIEDVKNSFKLLNEQSEFNTVLFTTHDIELAVELAQCIYVIGYPTINGFQEHIGTVVAKYDLREMGLCWKEYCEDHRNVVKEIVKDMMNS